jgi:carbonic anhydrase
MFFMNIHRIAIVIFLCCFICQLHAQSIDSTLNRLLKGNRRFMSQMALHPNGNIQTVMKTSRSQMPYALIHTCSDSRVSPEIIFDQGIGDLFVTRVAGNVMGDGGLGSIEYAVEHLGVRFILILGHTKCGAVSAAVSGEMASGHISWIVNKIAPSYYKVKEKGADKIDLTVRENVKQSINEVLLDSELIDLSYHDKIMVAGGVYNIENGSVEIIIAPQRLKKASDQNKKN